MTDTIETQRKMAAEADEARPGLPVWARWAILGLAAVFALAALGFSAGATVTAIESGWTMRRALLVALGLLPVIGFAVLLWRFKPYPANEPVAPKVRQANAILLWSLVLGGVIGMVLAIATDSDDTLYSNGTLAPLPSAIVVAAYCGLGSLMTWRWMTKADELELAANKSGALAGIYAYMLIAPSWWMLWRGGLMPAPDTMITFVIVITIYASAYLWRRNR